MLTKDQRMQSWNVRFMVGTDAVAGIYQRNDMLHIADVAREIHLCLVFNRPDAESWQPALLLRDAATGPNQVLLVLDQQDQTLFPTPRSKDAQQYDFVFHQHTQCAGESTHSLGDSCIRRADLPRQRYDPRYLDIGKKFTDPRIPTVPLRKIAGTKRRNSSSATASISNTTSASPGRATTADDEVPASIISFEEARPRINAFRSNVLANGYICAFSGMGKSWLPGGVAGPGVEAAHVVPHLHWHTYPFDDEMRVADINNPIEMKQVWQRTWTFSNGLPMLSHLHKCFDDRIISIHPETRRIRAFADYDILTQYHGQLAHLPANIDSKALRHHWDMCCLENMRSCWLVQEPDPKTLVLTPVPRIPLGGSIDSGQNLQQTTPQAPAPFSNPQRPPRPASPEERNLQSDLQTLSPICDLEPESYHPTYKTENAREHPPSPPSSEPGPEKCALWWLGNEVIDNAADAEALMRKGWLLELMSEEDVSSKIVRRALSRRRRQRAGEQQLWWCGTEVINNGAQAEALTKQGWLLQPIDLSDDEEESSDEGEQSGNDDPDAQSKALVEWLIV
ncbi:hypothetical protein INS49_003959 [Diaporthe citri]|uniref:uncharacterized protein n=1 Tax=Diaporthe citri TaxID=83186 RepID=UPI001C7FF055|nr:uncharacterized protein INS49_003959 [Diaporthe citri]KAG6354878.1 hypothetical protein INS49_003959 [Diaporthe citri]